MTARLTESVVEEAALEWFGALGYAVASGPAFAPRLLSGELSVPAADRLVEASA